jgi:hypothetical protein
MQCIIFQKLRQNEIQIFSTGITVSWTKVPQFTGFQLPFQNIETETTTFCNKFFFPFINTNQT